MLMIVFLATVFFMMFATLTRFCVRNVLIGKMGIDNAFTRIVLFDAIDLDNSEDESIASDVSIDWSKEYPFSEKDLEIEEEYSKESHAYDHYTWIISDGKERIERNLKMFIPGYNKIVELSNFIEQSARWNFVNYSEYNGIVLADDNYFADIKPKQPLEENAKSIENLCNFCKEQDIDFIYAQQPNKFCKYEDKGMDSSLDFSNYNDDYLLNLLKKGGVDTYDHRVDIHNDNLNHHSIFYGTDHHWKGETGRWAAKHLLEEISKRYGYNVDSELLAEDLFNKKTYKGRLFGSQGKKVGLKVAHPEDFTLLYPTFETKLHFVVPNKGIDLTGNFEITYDMSHLKQTDYYHSSEYGAYNYSLAPVHKIENLNNNNGPKILLISDSFANCEVPFIALGVKSIDHLDLRYFTGSVKSYIKENKPDIVIVTYSFFYSDFIDWASHTAPFDFR